MAKALIGIDLGGTRIKSVVLDASGNILKQAYSKTEDGDGQVWKQTISRIYKDLVAGLGHADFAVGISAPGLPNEDHSEIAYMPGRLEGLEKYAWSILTRQKTWVLNDAVAALLAEARLGSAKNRKNAVLITLGTGVGGAILIDGKLYQGSFKKAGHIGHITLDHEGPPDVTGMPGSLEDAIGNSTISRRSLGRFQDTNDLLVAYRNGDHFAKNVWLESIRKLAVGIASVTNILSPECVIIGGGITEAGIDLFEPLEDFLSLYEWRAGGNRTAVLKSNFGDMAGAVGAACFAKEQGSSSK